MTDGHAQVNIHKHLDLLEQLRNEKDQRDRRVPTHQLWKGVAWEFRDNTCGGILSNVSTPDLKRVPPSAQMLIDVELREVTQYLRFLLHLGKGSVIERGQQDLATSSVISTEGMNLADHLLLSVTLSNFSGSFLHWTAGTKSRILRLMVLNVNVVTMLAPPSLQLRLQSIFPDCLEGRQGYVLMLHSQPKQSSRCFPSCVATGECRRWLDQQCRTVFGSDSWFWRRKEPISHYLQPCDWSLTRVCSYR